MGEISSSLLSLPPCLRPFVAFVASLVVVLAGASLDPAPCEALTGERDTGFDTAAGAADDSLPTCTAWQDRRGGEVRGLTGS